MNAADYFYKLLKPFFPDNANLSVIDLKTSDLVFRVDWRVPTESRPSRRSRPIHILVSEDVLDDYRDDPLDQQRRDVFIKALIQKKFDSFSDDEIASPPIEWHITPDNTYSRA